MNGMINGWKRIALAATTIIALGGAAAVLENFAPWAPRVTLALATENSLARLDNQLITLIVLEAQAKAAQDHEQARRLKVMIKRKEREIKGIEKLKDRHQ